MQSFQQEHAGRSHIAMVGVDRIVVGSDYNMDAGYPRPVEFVDRIPALTKDERAMQVKLVKRTPKGVELTAVGSALRTHVHRLRLSLDDVVHEAADLSQGRAGNLRVGTGAGMGGQFVAAACSAFLIEAPKATLALTIARNALLLPALHNGEHDLVVSGIPHSSYTFRPRRAGSSKF